MNQLLVIILDLLNHVTDVNPVEALHKKVIALNPLSQVPICYSLLQGDRVKQRNVDITNLNITKSSIKNDIIFPSDSKICGNKPLYNEQILPVL